MDILHIKGQITISDLNNWIDLLSKDNPPLVIDIEKSYGAKNSDDPNFLTKDFVHVYALFMKSLKCTSRLLIVKSVGYVLAGSMAWILAADVHYSMKNTKFGFPEIRVNELPILVSSAITWNISNIRRLKFFLVSGELFCTDIGYEMGMIDRLFDDKEELDHSIQILYNRVKLKSVYLKRLPVQSIEEGLDLYEDVLLEK